mmetsp:Transcript_6888/g.12365  ORF Transcript_6888/g.12365 Transcript_6888/m.12365 type:complete len:89 (-) Transcript_6888:118-384(-)
MVASVGAVDTDNAMLTALACTAQPTSFNMAGLDDQPPPLGIEAAHIVMAAASIGDGAHGDAEGAVLARESHDGEGECDCPYCSGQVIM